MKTPYSRPDSSFALGPELRAALAAAAKHNGTSKSALLRQALTGYLKSLEGAPLVMTTEEPNR
jgi:predicted DNA-binding protein